jgi:type III secretory pathway component EscS
MSGYLVMQTLGLCLQVVLAICGAVLLGGILSGILQGVTKIRDDAISFTFKVFSLGVAVTLLGSSFSGQVTKFAARLWGGADLYR